MNIENFDLAVSVKKVNLTYGGCFGRAPQNAVLKQLSMQIPRGSIYGLLGPSGCGKTSIIRCILGTLAVDSGEIVVFNTKPDGSSSSLVPGSGVGYMPQDISLYSDLSIAETLQYFGSLYGLDGTETEKRSQFLISFLNLPNQSGFVGKLSGGQKRRVSLATALIHKPPLLILDEPTVGVDPLLRKSIWLHLAELSQIDKLTVLITTHYIEEAKNANLVGLMRDGKILEQENPELLLQKYNLNSLEDVFLHLCTGDEEKKKRKRELEHLVFNGQKKRTNSEVNSICSTKSNLSIEIPESIKPEIKILKPNGINQIGTIVRKNLQSLRRSPGYLLFQFLLPMVEAALFCLCLGRDLHSIPVSVYNGDGASNFTNGFLHEIDSKITLQTHFETKDEAVNSVREGLASSALLIYPGFSNSLLDRLSLKSTSSSDINSTIHLVPDMSNQLMVSAVQKEILRAFMATTKTVLTSIGPNPNYAQMPVQLDEPVYGRSDPQFTEFMVPGALLSLSFFAALSLTTMNLVVERRRGMIERTIVVGVSHFQIICSHLLTNVLVLLVQVAVLLIMVFAVFKIPYAGSLFWITILTILQSICGMCFGLLISSVSDTENIATMLSLGAFFPNFLLSGAMWPLEAMHDYLRYFALTLPQTFPTESIRFMVIRGWELTHWQVATGFGVTMGWIGAFVLLSTMVIKYKKL